MMNENTANVVTIKKQNHLLTGAKSKVLAHCFRTSALTAAVAVTAFSPLAHASSVTLYGVLDDGIDYANNEGGHGNTKLVSGVMSSNRWGLKGTEDVGAGTTAIFDIENGFDVNTGKLGQNSREFGRQSWVGLSSQQYGTVTLGRQWDIFGDFLWEAVASNGFGSWMASHPGDVDNLDSTYKSNNALKYISPSWYGWSFGGTYAFGNQAGSVSRDSIWSGAVRYWRGPIKIAAGYVDFNRPNLSSWDGTQQAVGPFAVAAPVAGGYASASHQRIAAVAGTVDILSKLTVGGSLSYTRFSGLGSDAGPNPQNFHNDVLFYNGELNVLYHFQPDFSVGAFYDFTASRPHDGQGGARYHQTGATADYILSKTTDIYLIAQYQRALGTDSTGKMAVAQIDGLSASSTANQWVTRLGIRHRF